jgi:peptidoglycan/xylan/chitin deacetylase (PgdA/CDA1 family)
MRLCAVSVDLDEIPNYFAIHGVPPIAGAGLTAVYDIALPRLLTLAEDEHVPLTLFAIGSDLERDVNAAALARAHADGHEIGNHTLDHRYDLVKLGRAEIAHQIEGGMRAIASATGEVPVGFRAPGYTITDEVFDVLADIGGIQYDSSVFPCPPYWAAKAATLGFYRAKGRESRSLVDTPNVLRAPIRPYFVGRPYWKRGPSSRSDGSGTTMLELPVQVTPKLRLPFIGTTLTLAGPTGARRLAEMCVGEPLVNLELHGIDVLDERDGLETLASHQHDVRVVRERKLAALRAVIEVLKSAGYTFTTLRSAATQLV